MCEQRAAKMSGLMNPSLASATGTRLDSACKHIQQCRVSQDHMTKFAGEDEQEMVRNKYKYAVHKDELVLGIGRCWKEDEKILRNDAYPRVLSNLGKFGDEANNVGPSGKSELRQEIKLIKVMYHNMTSITQRDKMIKAMQDGDKGRWEAVCVQTDTDNLGVGVVPTKHTYLTVQADKPNTMSFHKDLNMIHDFITVGFANTLGYAHAHNGDTMTSVMIGGLRTVMNGEFEMYCGDVVQWYWPFEKDCFKKNGQRHAICSMFGDPSYPSDPWKSTGDELMRKAHHDREYGQSKGNEKLVPRIKPYHRDDENPRLYDWYRVFAVAISSARPNEAVDIRISRQAL
jgi:hypothetical protein